jgi:hypothetical protein
MILLSTFSLPPLTRVFASPNHSHLERVFTGDLFIVLPGSYLQEIKATLGKKKETVSNS